MYNFSEKQKIILALFTAVILIGFSLIFPSLKTNLETQIIKTQEAIKKINERFSVLAQSLFLRYPERLIYLALEISQASNELIFLNEKLDRNMGQCDCKLAQSQCLAGPPPEQVQEQIRKEFSVGLPPEIARKIDKAVLSVNERITKSISKAESKTAENFNKIQEKLSEIKKQETPKKPEGKLRFLKVVWAERGTADIVNELEQTLNSVKNQTLGKLKSKEEEVKENIEKHKTSFKNELSKLKNYPETEIVRRFEILYQKFLQDTENELTKLDPGKIYGELENEFQNVYKQITNLPSQLLSDIQNSLQASLAGMKSDLMSALDLQDIFTFLKNPLDFLLQGGCAPGPIGAFGEPCPNRDTIEKGQVEIKEKAEQISFLRNLLIKEMESGLERELATLDKETADELRNGLQEILREVQNISSLAMTNSQLPSNCSAKNCSANCGLGTRFKAEACVEAIRGGEQKPITLKFKVEVGLNDLKLGNVRIGNVNLGLPEEVDVEPLGNLTVTIPDHEIAVSFPPQETLPDLSSQTYTIHPADTLLPKAPNLTLPCPKLTGSSYQCSAKQEENTREYPDLAQYFEQFTQLSQECQESLGPDPQCEKEVSERQMAEYEKWLEDCKLPAECRDKECQKNPECLKKYQCKEKQECINKVNEEIGRLKAQVKELCKRPGCFDPQNIVQTISDECDRFEQEQPPIPLPPICQKIKLNPPQPLNYTPPPQSCAAQKISSFPSSMLGCAASPPTIPKINLPSIKLPDIKLREFKLLPFIYVKLPGLILEDLILPQIDLCNIDECKNFFPRLNFRLPALTFPRIDVPEAQAPEPGAPKVRIEAFSIPPIPFPLPQLSQLSLASLMTPELDLEGISLPRPQISVGLEDVDINIAWAIASFFLNSFGVPMPEFYACVAGFIQAPLPVTVISPDYYFAWPAFPDIPAIPYCKDVNNFCRTTKERLKTVTDKVPLIQNTVNATLQKKIQEKLDKAAVDINKEISGEIQKYLEKVSRQIKKEVEEKIKSAEVRDEKIYIPPAFVKVDGFSKTYNLGQKAGIARKINIPWPKELKRVSLSQPIQYALPDIPLSKLSYSKIVPLQGPGFQTPSISVDFQYGAECGFQPAGGGNPCPAINLGNIQAIQGKINEASRRIVDILE